MTGYELRLWRKGQGWTQERAAEEFGVALRTYKNHELRNNGLGTVPAVIEKAAAEMALCGMLSELHTLSRDAILLRLEILLQIRPVTDVPGEKRTNHAAR